MKIVFLNNEYMDEAKCTISIQDRGFLLGDGIFETLRLYSGTAPFLKQHWERLIKSAEILEIPVTITFEKLKEILNKLIEKNNLTGQEASARLTLTRGPSQRGISFPVNLEPTFLVSVFPLNSQTETMSRVLISKITRNERSPLSSIKSVNYLENILARREAEKSGFDEALLLNTQGNLSEAATANIFFVKKEMLCTPRIEDGALPGITREIILKLAQSLGIQTKIASFSPAELLEAEEAFMSNSLLGVKPIQKINERLFGEKPGPVTVNLSCAFQEYSSLF